MFVAPPPGSARGARRVRGTNAHPTTHYPILRTPIPTRTSVTLSQWPFFFKANLGREHGNGSEVGAWGVEPSEQPVPTQLLWRPASPLGCEGGRSARPSQKVGGVWVMDGYWLSRPGYLGSAVYTPPPRPPPIIVHLISGHHIRKSGAGWGRRGEGLGAYHSGGRGWGVFLSPQPARLGAVALGVASEENPYCPKWMADFNDDYDVSWCDANGPPPLPQKPAARRTLTGVLRHKKSLLKIAIFIFN